jgi:predicted ribosome quality control (RQC) complex YloA/Tae2 family protein
MVGQTVEELAAVVEEVAPVLVGGWIQKVFQPTPRAIVLEIRSPGRTLRLFCSAEPEMARLHLISRPQPNPASPPPFCQFLRAHIQGARIDAIDQVPGDRVVRLGLTARAGPCALIVELTGRTADLWLVDRDEKILTSLTTGQARAGQSYRLPASRLQPVREPRTAWPPPNRTHPFPVSLALEERYQQREGDLAHSRLRDARQTAIRKAIKKTARRTEALRADLEKAAQYREYARYGELLKANLGKLKKGMAEVTLVDYFDPDLPELTLPLDQSKGPQANMEDYFKKHRKALAADQELTPRLQEAERQVAALREELAAIQRGEWKPEEAEAIQPSSRRSDLAGSPPPTLARRQPGQSGPFRRFISTDGLPIYVGRNARENEELTFKFAHSDDLWLHAHGTPGSHVVIRLEKGADPPPETLRDAATLAVLYSDLKKSGKGEVIYTRRKWVRKIKGQPPGTVTVTQEKAIFVQLDRARLDRLKERSANRCDLQIFL